MSIATNLQSIKSTLPTHVTLVAESKTKSDENILDAYNSGHRIFGENKIQEMVSKWKVLPKDIQWHMIGHVQRNKVKYMAEFVALIHGVDSLKLLKEIDKQAKKHNRTINCLLQIHIAEEDTKFGLDKVELDAIIKSEEFNKLQNIHITGLMGMATFTDDQMQIRKDFQNLKCIYDKLSHLLTDIYVLSMGMSGDYTIAIEEVSTMVRIGSSIFGPRNM